MQPVPRLSHVKREIAQGSPTALVRARIKHERRVEKIGDDNFTRPTQSNNSDVHDSAFPEIVYVQRLIEARERLRGDTASLYICSAPETAAPARPHGVEALRNAAAILQRVGRGYLLRSFPVDQRQRRSGTPEHSKMRGASVSFIGSDDEFTPAPFQKSAIERTKALRSVYSLSQLPLSELDGMIGEAKKACEHSAWKRLAAPQASRLQRSASTLFLAAPEEPSAVRKPTEHESIRQKLMKVDVEMKRRLADLDKKTREAQRVQDLVMLDLARDEAAANERQRQAKAQAREQARATRQLHREEEKIRDQEVVAERKALHREYEIKRTELHVELRQRYMLEDRVTALRKTLAELTNVSHLSSTVPSLNLTQATKEAHFRAEALAHRKSHEDP